MKLLGSNDLSLKKRVISWWERLLDRPFQPGTIIHHRYLIKKILGMGSYGLTYLCEDTTKQVFCVLKQVKPSKRKGKKGYPIFQRETDILSALAHPSIPKLYEKFEDRGHLFFAMEYVEGFNLEEYLFDQQGSFTEEEALYLIKDLLVIVQYLHDHQIIHRDVRLPNVILGANRLHLIDFGLARYLGDSPTSIAESLGDYPIEKQLKREVDVKSDFYALGHFLLFLLYSTFDPEGKVPSTWEDELDITLQTRTLLKKLLQMDEPYENAAELHKDLEEAIQHIRNKREGYTMGTS